jgi:hypothetical protein
MDGQGRPSTCTWCVGINNISSAPMSSWSPAAVRSVLMTMGPQPMLATPAGRRGGSPLLDATTSGTTTSFDYGAEGLDHRRTQGPTWAELAVQGVDIFARRHQVHAGAEVHVQVAAVGRHRFQRDLVVAQEAQRGWIMDTTMVYCSSDSKKNLVMVG